MPTLTAASPARNVGATTLKTRSAPAPAAPMRASAGTATSSSTIATLELPAIPRPFHAPSKLTPSASPSTAKQSRPSASALWRRTSMTSAWPPEVTKLLRPLTRTEPLSRSAASSGL